MHPESQLAVCQCVKFSANTKLPHNQAVKHVLKYLKSTATQVLIIKNDPEEGIECYIDYEFSCV